jgi:uncharacterized membrane protein
MTDHVLLRAAVLGAAAGARSATPLAALAQRRGGPVRILATLAAAGELVVDKLPGTPSRLEPGPLGGRIVLGALAGAVLARRAGAGVVAPALIAAVAAVAASHAGASWRAYASRRGFGTPGALAEDAAAVIAASIAAEGALVHSS